MSLRILIVDDSPTARRSLCLALEAEDDIEVVGEVTDGTHALAAVRRFKPDLVTMDVFLDGENGLDVASRIMIQSPCPILVVTAADPKEPRLVYRTLEAGALDVVAKLPSPIHAQYSHRRNRLIRLVRILAKVPVVKRHGRTPPGSNPTSRAERRSETPNEAPPAEGGVDLVVIGASTGGPPVLVEMLQALKAPFPVPIAIVQHIMKGFAQGFCDWLEETTGHRCCLVKETTKMLPGVVYLAADERHLEVVSPTRIGSSTAPPRVYQRPSVDVLFESAVQQFASRALGVLLTGMGKDGAAGMSALYEAQAITLAQEPSTCAIDSMPVSAIDAGVVRHVDRPERLSRYISELCLKSRVGT